MRRLFLSHAAADAAAVALVEEVALALSGAGYAVAWKCMQSGRPLKRPPQRHALSFPRPRR